MSIVSQINLSVLPKDAQKKIIDLYESLCLEHGQPIEVDLEAQKRMDLVMSLPVGAQQDLDNTNKVRF